MHELLGNNLPSRKTAAAYLEHQNFPSEQCGYFLTAITYDKACEQQQTVYYHCQLSTVGRVLTETVDRLVVFKFSDVLSY